MSDFSQGEGWWLASDGKWYAPEQHPSAQGTAPVPASTQGWWSGLNTAQRFAVGAIIAGALGALGCLLPWVEVSAAFFGTISRSGVDDGGDGLFVLLALALMTGFLVPVLRGADRAVFPIVAVVMAAIATLITVYDVIDVQSAVNDLDELSDGFATASVGIGLWLSAAASIAALVLTVIVWVRLRQVDAP